MSSQFEIVSVFSHKKAFKLQSELFGNFTSQPDPPQGIIRNGFNALAEFDKPANGGNGDGKISDPDSIFFQLRLWRDLNHNGISELNEIGNLTTSGVVVIDLAYESSKRTDQHGNQFKYRARLLDSRGAARALGVGCVLSERTVIGLHLTSVSKGQSHKGWPC